MYCYKIKPHWGYIHKNCVVEYKEKKNNFEMANSLLTIEWQRTRSYNLITIIIIYLGVVNCIVDAIATYSEADDLINELDRPSE